MTGWRKKPEHQAGPDVWSEGVGVDEAEWRLVGQAAETAPVAARGVRVHSFQAARASGVMLRAWGRGLLGLALPPTCAACGQVVGDDGGLCPQCWRHLHFITPPLCVRTGAPLRRVEGGAEDQPALTRAAVVDPPAFDRARAAVMFNDVARKLVHGLKYADRLDLAAIMARMMAQAGHGLLAEADMIVPVPLHMVRMWRRRFNQAALLARHLQKGRARMGQDLPVRMDILHRVRRTPSQTRLDRMQRRANVAGAFALARAGELDVRGRRVLLVDDVYTTGATLDACAALLRQAGAARVDVLTFARVDDPYVDETDMTGAF
ncbi:ComF family protein [Xanthobacter sp. TB0136]|uniref:ComF family protein n=1 Tax=Xanthobacter sp. TB0136 TaxID=3459177 RepID=UPI00403A3369